MKTIHFCLLIITTVLFGCAPGTRIAKYAQRNMIRDSSLQHAHVGIAIYDPEKQKYLYRKNADQYFIPASNVKIFSCYAGMKFIGDQLPGVLYAETDTALFLVPTGDPTFLHEKFPSQPVASLIRDANKKIYVNTSHWNTKKYGTGWSWDDYNEDYMPERSPMPIYGNTVKWYQVKSKKEEPQSPSDTIDTFIYSDPEIEGRVDFGKPDANGHFNVTRDWSQNNFILFEGKEKNAMVEVPFATNGIATAIQLIRDSLHKELIHQENTLPESISKKLMPLYSRPLDSMLRRMMFVSDNLFAEQTILLASMMQLGTCNTDLFLKKLLETEFQNMPNNPTWADGSGLSRFNLFSPQDLIWVLDKLQTQFPWERITNIFPTGGLGTLGGPFIPDSSRIYAKTGTLTGVTALSGYVITAKNRKLIFSMMINNHKASASMIRRKFADLLHECMKDY